MISAWGASDADYREDAKSAKLREEIQFDFFAQLRALRVFAVNLSRKSLESQFPSMRASISAPSDNSEMGTKLP